MFPTGIPSPLAHAGLWERGQGASRSPPPAAEGKRPSGGQRWESRSRSGHRLLKATQRVGDRTGSKCPALFFGFLLLLLLFVFSWLLRSPKFLPKGYHLPPRTSLSARSDCSLN